MLPNGSIRPSRLFGHGCNWHSKLLASRRVAEALRILTSGEKSMRCRICQEPTARFADALILKKYPATYFRCAACGFVQLEEPIWIEEAYSHAISRLDVGIMQRNVTCTDITSALIRLIAPNARHFLDFGGGHGTLVRMMRDRGFDFRWQDAYAQNLHARGFEHKDGMHYNLVVAFEVLEHLVSPLDDIAKMMNLGDTVFVSTLLLPEPPPQPDEWWYYALGSGQHISLYSLRSLEFIARKFDRHLVSDGAFHLFTRKPVSRFAFHLATRPKVAGFLRPFLHRPSLTQADFESMANERDRG